MNNYVLLYSGGKMPQTDAELTRSRSEWRTWYNQVGNNLVDGGNPFSTMARSITSDGKVIDGSPCLSASGYSIIKADSLDAAIRYAKTCPILKFGAEISVFETFNAMN